MEFYENPDYADLAFEIGKVYWYYYDYGKTEDSDNQITRMKGSIKWFEDAVKYGSKESDYVRNGHYLPGYWEVQSGYYSPY